MKAFISHSHRDAPFAEWVAEALRAARVQVFSPSEMGATASSLQEAYERELRNADALLVVVSSASVKSEFVLSEVGVARFAGIPIIPLVIEEVIPPSIIAGYLWIDFTAGSEVEGFQQLREALYHFGGIARVEPESMTEREATDVGVVLSEDAYHTQFVDAFNWSNLVQLIELTQSTCLLVGLSVTDPNLRRLLDVAARKNAARTSPHYLIKLHPGAQGPFSSDSDEQELLQLVQPRVRVLEELDAKSLGLNVIWVDSYDEMPGVLERVGS